MTAIILGPGRDSPRARARYALLVQSHVVRRERQGHVDRLCRQVLGLGQSGTAGSSAVDSRDFVAELKATIRAFFTGALFHGVIQRGAI